MGQLWITSTKTAQNTQLSCSKLLCFCFIHNSKFTQHLCFVWSAKSLRQVFHTWNILSLVYFVHPFYLLITSSHGLSECSANVFGKNRKWNLSNPIIEVFYLECFISIFFNVYFTTSPDILNLQFISDNWRECNDSPHLLPSADCMVRINTDLIFLQNLDLAIYFGF